MSETVGYARVSTREQHIEPQRDKLREAGVTRLFQEKVSGVDRDRPELNRMLEYGRSGDTLVVTRIDRIARSTKHLLDITELLKDKGVTLKILNINLDTSNPAGKMMLTMLGAIAEFERDLLLERQKGGIEKAKQLGKYTGRKPTARAKAEQVKELLAKGYKKTQIAKELEISVASVYRILAD